jgi:hypothetical protein
MVIWLVVWNIFLLFQLTFIFFRGVETTNQKSVGLPTENGTSPAMNWEPAAHVISSEMDGGFTHGDHCPNKRMCFPVCK